MTILVLAGEGPLGWLADFPVYYASHSDNLGVNASRNAVVDLPVDLGKGISCEIKEVSSRERSSHLAACGRKSRVRTIEDG